MKVQEQIKEYIANLPEPKRNEIQALHRIILQLMPACKLWFLDGKNSEGKTVSNPNIGYGFYTIQYTNARPPTRAGSEGDDRVGRGKTKEFYQIGLSANTTGISVYIMGIKDKKYLANKYGKEIGKASVTGYCIKFKTLKDINIDVLQEAMQYGVEATNEKS